MFAEILTYCINSSASCSSLLADTEDVSVSVQKCCLLNGHIAFYLWMFHHLFKEFPTDGHLSCLQTFAISENASMKSLSIHRFARTTN